MPRTPTALVALLLAASAGAPLAGDASAAPSRPATQPGATDAVFPPPLPLAASLRGAFPGDLTDGAEHPAVALLQRRLEELRFVTGGTDGLFGTTTRYAVQGFQKLVGLEPTGVVDATTWTALLGDPVVVPRVPTAAPDRLEVDLDAQLLVLWDDDRVALVSHISSGSGLDYCEDGVCGRAVTPRGAFTILRRIPGWRVSRLGQLYNPLYFHGGFAVHGSASVPTHPASHGCVRVPMDVAEILPGLVPNGTEIYVFDAEHPPEAIIDPARIRVAPVDPFA